MLTALINLKYQEDKEWNQCENTQELYQDLIAYGEAELIMQSVVNEADLLVSVQNMTLE
jgi:hypothetical protein